MHLNSQNGSINVLLVNHDTKSDTPVVVQVPPPEDGAPPVPLNAIFGFLFNKPNSFQYVCDIINSSLLAYS